MDSRILCVINRGCYMLEKGISRLSDLELAERYRSSGDMPSFGELYRRYAHLVMGMCIKYLKDKDEARDAVSAVFEKLIRALRSTSVQNFPGWLGFVTRNHCISALRKRNTREALDINEAEGEELMESGEDARLYGEESEAALQQAIASLKEEQQLCIRMFYLDGKSYAEISAYTGMEMNAVKSHLQNGKRNLKIILEKNARIPR